MRGVRMLQRTCARSLVERRFPNSRSCINLRRSEPRYCAAKRSNSPLPPVLFRSVGEQTPPGPRDGCAEFHERLAAVIAHTSPIDVAKHCAALSTTRPILAGAVLARRKGPAIHLRASQGVMIVWSEAADRNFLPRSVRLISDPKLVVVAVQVVDILRHDDGIECCHGPLPMWSRALIAGLPSMA